MYAMLKDGGRPVFRLCSRQGGSIKSVLVLGRETESRMGEETNLPYVCDEEVPEKDASALDHLGR